MLRARAIALALALAAASPAALDALHGADDRAAAAALTAAANAELPYSAFLFQLDLSVLAYATWAQSLFWPGDPFYDAPPPAGVAKEKRKHRGIADAVRSWWVADNGKKNCAATCKQFRAVRPGGLCLAR